MYKVLLVDDIEPFRRKIMRFPFWKSEGSSFEIAFEASDGLEALEILKNNKVDVLITDIRMPLIDGIELLKRVKKSDLCPCVVLLSEFADFSYAKEGIINGAFDYLVKPVDEEAIVDTFGRVKQFLDSSRVEAEPIIKYQLQMQKSILEMDREKGLLLAGRITQELLKEHKQEEQFLFSVYQCLKETVESIIKEKPFLSAYISCEDIVRISSESRKKYERENLLVQKVSDLFDQLQITHVDDYSENVKKLCLMALQQEGDKLSLTKIADRFYMNAKYLGSQFKQETGMSYNQYITHLKIRRAKILLKNNKLKIFEIAEQLGFDNVEYFNKVFKKETGISPGRFRKQFDNSKTYDMRK